MATHPGECLRGVHQSFLPGPVEVDLIHPGETEIPVVGNDSRRATLRPGTNGDPVIIRGEVGG